MAAPWCELTFLSDLWGAHLGGQGAPARGLQSPVPPAAQVRPVGDGHAPRPQEGRGPHPAKEPSKHRSPWPALSFWDVAWTSASLGLSRWAERVSLPRLPLKGLMPLRAPAAGARTAGPQQGRGAAAPLAGPGRGLGRGRAPPRRQAGVWPRVPSAGGCTLTCGAAGAAGLPGSEGLSSPHGGETQSARPAGRLAAPCWCWVKETSRADNTGHKTVPSALCPAAPDSASARAARRVPAPAPRGRAPHAPRAPTHPERRGSC